jgi:dolichyl-phosphate-mannose-protein mannosyltransferase
MSSPQVRQRVGQKDKKATASPPQSGDGDLNGIRKDTKLPNAVTSEWDYKTALVIITVLAFITRFWGIGHPNEVVFDEVHFGKV